MADLSEISTDDSLVLHFGKEVEYTLQLRPWKLLFISLAVKMNNSSLKFTYLPFYPTLWHEKDWSIQHDVKSVHFGHVHFQLFAPVNTCARESTFFILPRNSNFWAINSFLQRLIFPANVFHEITGITDALKKNAHDQNEQTILSWSTCFPSRTMFFQSCSYFSGHFVFMGLLVPHHKIVSSQFSHTCRKSSMKCLGAY